MDKVGAIAAYCDIGSKYAAITPTIYYILCISWIIKRLFILAYTFTPVRHTDFLTDNKNRPKAPPPKKKINAVSVMSVGPVDQSVLQLNLQEVLWLLSGHYTSG